MTSTADWLASQGIGQADQYLDATQLAMMRAQQQEAAEAAAEAERQAAREADRDARLTSMYLAGVQPGAAVARAQRIDDIQTERQGHMEAIARLDGQLERLQRQAAAEAEAVSRSAVLASRSAPLDPVEATLQRARRVHREFSRNTRAALSAAVTGRPPKGGGSIARSDQPVDCPHCAKLGCTSEESFMIHHTDVDGNPLSADRPDPATVPDDNERRSDSSWYGVIVR